MLLLKASTLNHQVTPFCAGPHPVWGCNCSSIIMFKTRSLGATFVNWKRDKDRARTLATDNGRKEAKKRVEIIWLQLNNKRICLATTARFLANTTWLRGRWQVAWGMRHAVCGGTVGNVCRRITKRTPCFNSPLSNRLTALSIVQLPVPLQIKSRRL